MARGYPVSHEAGTSSHRATIACEVLKCSGVRFRPWSFGRRYSAAILRASRSTGGYRRKGSRAGPTHAVCDTRRRASHLRKLEITSAHFRFDRARGEFKLTCNPPCHSVTYFHRTMLIPYSVSNEGLERGYAPLGECQTISEGLESTNPQFSGTSR